MAIDNVFDLYNKTLNEDKPIVDQIEAAIKAELEVKVDEGIHFFDFSIAPYITDILWERVNRIMDRVIFRLRNNGLHCLISKTPMTGGGDITPYFTPYYNGLSGPYDLLRITWQSRNNQEFMKSYV